MSLTGLRHEEVGARRATSEPVHAGGPPGLRHHHRHAGDRRDLGQPAPRCTRACASSSRARPGTICMTHASHFYPQGTNLYFIRDETLDDQEFYQFRFDIVTYCRERGGQPASPRHRPDVQPPDGEAPGQGTDGSIARLKRHFLTQQSTSANPGRTLGLTELKERGDSPQFLMASGAALKEEN
ncbi:MAG: hypothetical protein MZU91_06870 [Desulfosudis oleivorans]|nr:hypothetical protein [Desulfosudis oleivorans]